MLLEKNFNKIYVVESLFSNDRKTGSELYNSIIARKVSQIENMYSELIVVNSRVDFFAFFEAVLMDIRERSLIPYIHFEIHGNPNGFVLNSDQPIGWDELYLRLVDLNILVKNNLWISLATCYGAYIYSISINIAPFYAYIGSWDELNVIDLQTGFEQFFDTLLSDRNLPIEDALLELNRYNNNLPTEYSLFNTESIFNKVWSGYEEFNYEEDNFQQRIQTIADQGMNDPINTYLGLTRDFFVENAKKLLIEERENLRKEYRNRFFMIDLYPENAIRFKQ